MDNNLQKHSTERIRPSSSGSDSNEKAGGKRKRMPGTPHRKHQLPEDIPWTAARCNRLLRSIISRIQILRRLSENNFADKALAKKSPSRHKIIFTPEGDGCRRISPDGVQNLSSRLAALPALESPTKDGDDPEWLPENGSKPSQKTYAGKGVRAKKVKIEEPFKSASSSGAADFRSPFIKRILGPDAAKSPTNVITGTPRKLTSQKIVLDPKTHAERALRTLLDSFSTILSTTAPCDPVRKPGTRSLRNMCLRKVPEYIDFEQTYAYDNGEYEFDATETIYLQMEQKPGAGRSNDLRKMVRAHAVKLIVDAFDERSWPVESLDRLLDVCERNQAVSEGQRILQSWFAKAEGRNLNRLARFMAWSKILNCTGFFLRVLRETLEAGRISLYELDQCPGIWQELLNAIARHSTRIDAVEFLEVYVMACLGFEECAGSPLQDVRLLDRLKRDEILRNTMALVTALCWTLAEDSTGPVDTTTPCLTWLVYRMAINVRHGVLGRHEQNSLASNLSRDAFRNMEPLETSVLVLYALHSSRASDRAGSLQTDSIHHKLHSFILGIVPRSNQQALQWSRAEIICSAAKCIAHGSQPAADAFVQDVSTSLLLLSTNTATHLSSSFRQLAIVVASYWADYRSDKASYTFADEIERAAHQGTLSKNLQLTPRSSTKSHTFKWEETIGEWIASTPLPNEKEVDQIRYRKVDNVGLNAKDALELNQRCTAKQYCTGEHARGANRRFQGTSADCHVAKTVTAARQEAMCQAWKTLESECPDNETSPLNSNDKTEHKGSSDDEDENAVTKSRLAVSIAPSMPAFSAEEKASRLFESPKRPLESPLQTKTSQSVQSESSNKGLQERDELSATPHHGATGARSLRIGNSVDNDLEANILPSTTDDPFSQTPLTIRTRQTAPQHAESCIYVDRDELAMTPAQSALRSTSEAVTLNNNSLELTPAPEKRGEFDGLAVTPAKRIPPSMRVLRSAMKKTVGSTQNNARLELHDDLAMTPAHSKEPHLAKQASLRNPDLTQASERDELGSTPAVSRTYRSQSKQLQKTRGQAKNKTKTPLGVRSRNISTTSRDRKTIWSGDELGM